MCQPVVDHSPSCNVPEIAGAEVQVASQVPGSDPPSSQILILAVVPVTSILTFFNTVSFVYVPFACDPEREPEVML